MPPSVKRSLLHVNRFQSPLLNLIIAFSLTTVIVLTICVSYLSYDVTNSILNPAREIPTVKIVIILILLVLPLIFFLNIIWAYRASSRLLGAFERILRELDNILETKQKRHIQARENDRLANELLERVNKLIDRMA